MKDKEINAALPVLQILFADDDLDDHFFFKIALRKQPFQTHLTSLENGEDLMTYLSVNSEKLPDVLFLDNNMPRKNGFECLLEIKRNPKLKNLPVVIYSTYLHEDVADMMYDNGAHYYIRKTAHSELKKVLQHIFTQIVEKKFSRPSREQFILSPTRYNSLI